MSVSHCITQGTGWHSIMTKREEKRGVSGRIDPTVLERLENVRILTNQRLERLQMAILGVGMLILGLMMAYSAEPAEIGLVVLEAGVVGLIVYAVGHSMITSGYVSDFKQEILKPLIEGIDPSITYKAEEMIPRDVFDRSKLFGRYGYYEGDDHVSGSVDGVAFSMSELYVYDKRASPGHGAVTVDIFRGIFAIFDFNKDFESTLLIYPDVAQKQLGHLGRWLQSMNISKEPLVVLDNTKFESYFAVYGSDPFEARYLLDHGIMEQMVALRESAGVPIYFSFTGRKLYVAFDYGDTAQFEPDLRSSLLDDAKLQRHLEKIGRIPGIVKQLGLNRFLWSKEAPNPGRHGSESPEAAAGRQAAR